MTLLAMIVFRLWTRTGPRRGLPVIGPLAAAALILLSGLAAGQVGLTLSGIGYALGGVAVIAAGHGAAVLLARRRYAQPVSKRPFYDALIGVPLATVAFEEVAFRGVLWALIAHDHGPIWATGVTAVLFGLWHLSPEPGTVGEVAFTTLAGVVLGVLRDLSGGLLAPFVVHWTANGLGILVSARLSGSVPEGPSSPSPGPGAAR